MPALRGENSWLAGLGYIANVKVGIHQDIAQLQNAHISTLNNVGMTGAGYGDLRFDVNPAQWADAGVAL